MAWAGTGWSFYWDRTRVSNDCEKAFERVHSIVFGRRIWFAWCDYILARRMSGKESHGLFDGLHISNMSTE